MGYVWKRTRYVLPPDPEQEKKKDTCRSTRQAFRLGQPWTYVA
jgi:hypothetical protein